METWIVVRFEIVRASWSDFMVGRMCEIRVLSEVAGRKGRRLAESQACAAGSVEREGMSALGTVTVTEEEEEEAINGFWSGGETALE